MDQQQEQQLEMSSSSDLLDKCPSSTPTTVSSSSNRSSRSSSLSRMSSDDHNNHNHNDNDTNGMSNVMRQAIQFNRHEVKNGLLEAIGLLDSVKELQEQVQRTIASTSSSSSLTTPKDVQPEDPLLQDTLHSLHAHMGSLDLTLNKVLETVLDKAMVGEVVYGNYYPKTDAVSLPLLLTEEADKNRRATDCLEETTSTSTSSTSNSNIRIQSSESLPPLQLDRSLMRTMYRNAISNAFKYGKSHSPVTVELDYDHDQHVLRMDVINLPGHGHDQLLQLCPEQVAETVFVQGTRLPVHRHEHTSASSSFKESAGDGAWIIRKCAECLGGTCSINFTPEGTTLTVECPAQVAESYQPPSTSTVSSSNNTTTQTPTPPFALATNTWAIVVEDSGVQRKLLERFLHKAGISHDHLVILGKNSDEILHFGATVARLMRRHPHDKFLLIVDENLELYQGGTVTQTVSGSCCVQTLREELLPHEEDRLLALIRSANDSVEEIQQYQARGHGFLLKAPMKTAGILAEIEPLWVRRFPKKQANHKPMQRRGSDSKIGISSTSRGGMRGWTPASSSDSDPFMSQLFGGADGAGAGSSNSNPYYQSNGRNNQAWAASLLLALECAMGE